MSFTDFLGDNWQSLLGAGIGALAGSQGTQDTDITRAPYMQPGQQEGLVNFLNLSKQQYQAGPQQFYPGQQVAPLDPNVIAGQNAALGTVPVQQQLADTGAYGAGTLLQGGAGRVEGFNLPNQVGFGIDQGLENAVMNPIMRNLQERVLPGMNLAATSQGAFGGTRHSQMMGNAARDATGQAAEAVALANLNARQQSIGQRAGDINAMLSGRGQDISQNQIANQAISQGVNAMPDVMGAQLAPSEIMNQVGGARTQYNQALIDADRQRFDFNQTAAIDAIDRLGQRMNLTPQGSVTNMAGTDGNWASMLGGALGGISLVNQFRNPPS